jgi:hypothetical protein
VRGATAGDEVRYELRASAGAPALARPALRSSGAVSVVQVAKFIAAQLGMGAGTVEVSCAGEPLPGAVTVGLLVRDVWPREDGHLVLEYRFVSEGCRTGLL